MLHEIFDRSHDLGYAGLVVGSEQGGAVGHDELLSLCSGAVREIPEGESTMPASALRVMSPPS